MACAVLVSRMTAPSVSAQATVEPVFNSIVSSKKMRAAHVHERAPVLLRGIEPRTLGFAGLRRPRRQGAESHPPTRFHAAAGVENTASSDANLLTLQRA